ncbi:MAG: hypothetical protein K1X74_01470 [Pirellulales bacterium]|nr:hypothetical protein [Pirellulales bacterium]
MPPDSAESRIAPAAKPRVKANIYDVLLIIAFLALLIGCLMLYLEWSNYPSTKYSQLDAPATYVLAATLGLSSPNA